MVQHMKDYDATHIRGGTFNAHFGDKTASQLPPQETDGKIAKAQLFDGLTTGHTNGRSIEINDDNSLHIADYLTLEAWVNCDDTGSWRTIMSKFPEGTSQKDIYWYFNSGKVGAALHPVRSSDWTTTVSVDVGYWMYLVLVYDGSAMRMYKNGNEEATLSGLSGQLALKDNTYNLYLGSNIAWGEYHKGKMDEVRISSTPRSAEWIKTTYNNIDDPGDIGNPGFLIFGNEETS